MAELADQPAAVALDRLGPAREPAQVGFVVNAHQDRRAPVLVGWTFMSSVTIIAVPPRARAV